jgi:predicted RNA-binding Zn-ribbon protein involved in translation (DUF1610 family)
MARIREITCWNCAHKWREDLDQHQEESTIYKDDATKAESRRIENYRFTCPNCGRVNIREEPASDVR